MRWVVFMDQACRSCILLLTFLRLEFSHMATTNYKEARTCRPFFFSFWQVKALSAKIRGIWVDAKIIKSIICNFYNLKNL